MGNQSSKMKEKPVAYPVTLIDHRFITVREDQFTTTTGEKRGFKKFCKLYS